MNCWMQAGDIDVEEILGKVGSGGLGLAHCSWQGDWVVERQAFVAQVAEGD